MIDGAARGAAGPAARLPIALLDEDGPPPSATIDIDPGAVVLTCANCGAVMDERKCKLACLSVTSTACSRAAVSYRAAGLD